MVAAGMMNNATVPRNTMMIPSARNHPHLCLKRSKSKNKGVVTIFPLEKGKSGLAFTTAKC
jgi:hypothetical protein